MSGITFATELKLTVKPELINGGKDIYRCSNRNEASALIYILIYIYVLFFECVLV